MEGLLIVAPGKKNKMESEKFEKKEAGLLCIPLAAVSQDGEPQEGQEVNASLTAVIKKIDGEHVYLEPSTVNGEDLISGDQEEKSEEDKLRDRAFDEDKEAGF